MPLETAAALSVGSVPGCPRQIGQTLEFGRVAEVEVLLFSSAAAAASFASFFPASLEQLQKALDCVESWTWHSMPMTASYLERSCLVGGKKKAERERRRRRGSG